MPKKTTAICALIIGIVVLTSCQGDGNDNKEATNDNKDIAVNNDDKNEAYEAIIQKNNDFGINMMKQLNTDDADRNIFISPVSMYIALSMVYAGADNETQTEIATLLDTEDMTIDDLNEANASLLKMLNDQKDDDIQLDIANSLWIDERFNLNSDYDDIISQYYKGKIASIDSNDEAAADTINDWVSEKTLDKIDKVAEAPLGDNFVAMMVNAIYFNGDWSHPFDPDDTTDDTFYVNSGEENKVPFMTAKEELDYVKQDDYEGVKLPYGEDGTFSMYIYLPTEEGNLASIHQAFQDEGVEQVMGEMHQTEGTISLPKFKLDYEEEMNEVLEKLGMIQAFDRENADFPNIVEKDDSLYISEVKHTAYLEVNEEGTEAAGSTNVGMETTSLPMDETFDLKFDHPFVMLIANEATGTVLFMGDIYDVSA